MISRPGPGPLLLLLLATAVPGCRPARARDSDLDWSLHRVWSVGGATDRPVSLSRLEPFQVASNGVDLVYLLARAEHRVFVLGADGQVADSFGRRGEGPGEMVDPMAISVSSAGDVAVVDPGAHRIVRWDRQGRPLDPIAIRVALDHPRMVVAEGRVWYTTAERVGEDRAEYHLVADGPTGRVIVAALPKPSRRVGDFPSCGARAISVTPLFAPTIHWDRSGDRTIVNAGAGYRLQLFRGTTPVATLTRDIAPAPATPEAAEREAAGWLLNDCVVPPAEVLRVAGYLERIPVVSAVALAPDGTVWVERRVADGGGPRVDLFDTAGSYLGTLPAGAPFPAAFLAGDRIVAIERDSLDVPSLSLYRVDRGEPGQ
jgi:hypothetical protein